MSKKEVEVKSAEPVVRMLKPEVQDLSKKIVAGLDINSSEGVITETRDNYYDNLPEGVSKEQDDKISVYRTQFVAASAHAAGTLAIDALAKNKKLDTVTSEFKLGKHDVVRHGFERERDYTFGSGAERRVIHKVGVVTTEVDTRGGRNSGQLKIAREVIADLALDKLSKK